jgi:hypothetical protein
MRPEVNDLHTAIEIYGGDVTMMDAVLLNRLVSLCRPSNMEAVKTRAMRDLMTRAFSLAMGEWRRRYPNGALPPCMMEWDFPACYDGPRHFADLSDQIN